MPVALLFQKKKKMEEELVHMRTQLSLLHSESIGLLTGRFCIVRMVSFLESDDETATMQYSWR